MNSAEMLDSDRATGLEFQSASCGTLPRAGDWYLLHTKSRQEKLLSDELHRMGIGHYLPLARQVRFYGKRKAAVEVPLFPGYVFVRGGVDDTYQANRTHRVARVITVCDQPRLDWELSNLHLAHSGGAPLDPYPYLRKGVRAEVRSGPFRGLQGLIESVAGAGRLVLQVEMLGRAISVEIHGAVLEPV
jgi:transcription antitermination factor NusG